MPEETPITMITELNVDEGVHGVSSPANGMSFVLIKELDDEQLVESMAKASDPSDADRKKMAASGVAMPDGSYPIPDVAHLKAAIKAVGRGKSSHDTIRKHIIKRAKALGQSAMIPDEWGTDGTVKKAEDVPSDDGIPGSKLWEAADATRLNMATTTLLDLKSMLEDAAAREQIEGSTVDPDDMQQAWTLQDAAYMLNNLLGVVAAMAVVEQRESDMAPDSPMAKAVAGAGALIQKYSDLLDGVAEVATSATGADPKGDVYDMDITNEELTDMVAKAASEAVTVAMAKAAEDAAKLADDEAVAKAAADKVAADAATTDPAVTTATKTDADVAKETATTGNADLVTQLEAAMQKTVDEAVAPLKEQIAKISAEPAASRVLASASAAAHGNPKLDLSELKEKIEKATDPNEKAALTERLSRLEYLDLITGVAATRQ